MNKLAQLIMSDVAGNPNAIDLSALKGKTLLLTGASGIVGTYLLASLRNLIDAGTLDTKVAVVIQSEPEGFYADLLKSKNIQMFRGDLTSISFCESLPKADFIIHAAGYGQPMKFMTNPLKTIQLNTTATVSLLQKMNPQGSFLFISTSEVYSGLTKSPFKETEIGTTNTDHPRACYIEAKRCGEAICNSARAMGISAKSARLSLAYGPGTRADDKRVINNFIKKGIEGGISMMDHGLALRTYCYIADVAWMMWSILLHGKSEIYNVGGISRLTIAELAKEVGGYLKVPVTLPEVSAELKGAPDDVRLDMEKFEKEFGPLKFTPMNVGLVRTIEWQQLYFKNLK